MEYTFGIPLSGNVSVNADLTDNKSGTFKLEWNNSQKKEKSVTMTTTRCGSIVAYKN